VMNAAYLQIHRELEEASEACGATWATTMRRVVLPMLWPAFIRGWLWVFVHAIRDVSLALMLFATYNQTVGVTLWQIWMEHGNFQLGAAIAVPLLLVSLGLSLLIVRPTMRLKEPGIR
jgi:iron(III) transport system permease protein